MVHANVNCGRQSANCSNDPVYLSLFLWRRRSQPRVVFRGKSRQGSVDPTNLAAAVALCSAVLPRDVYPAAPAEGDDDPRPERHPQDIWYQPPEHRAHGQRACVQSAVRAGEAQGVAVSPSRRPSSGVRRAPAGGGGGGKRGQLKPRPITKGSTRFSLPAAASSFGTVASARSTILPLANEVFFSSNVVADNKADASPCHCRCKPLFGKSTRASSFASPALPPGRSGGSPPRSPCRQQSRSFPTAATPSIVDQGGRGAHD
jgi:hypothetical protein